MEACQPLTTSGSLEFGVPIDSTNSVFALLHSWFLPSSPANSSHLLRDKRFGAPFRGFSSYNGAIAVSHVDEPSQDSAVAGLHLRPPASVEPAATTAPGAMGSVLGVATMVPGHSSYAVSSAGAPAEAAPVEAAAGAHIPEPSSSGPQEPSSGLRLVAAPATPDHGDRAPPAVSLHKPRDPRRQLAASLVAAGELQVPSQAGSGNNSHFSSSGGDTSGSSGGCSGGDIKDRSGSVNSGHRNKIGGSNNGSNTYAIGEGIPARTSPEGAPPGPCDKISSPAVVAFVHRNVPPLPSSNATTSALGPGFWQFYGCKVAGDGAGDEQPSCDPSACPQAPLHKSSTGGSCLTTSAPAILSGQSLADCSESGTGGACDISDGGAAAEAPRSANVSVSGSAAEQTVTTCGGVSSSAGLASGWAAGRSECGSGTALPLGADGRTRSQPTIVVPLRRQPSTQQPQQRQVRQQHAWLQAQQQQQEEDQQLPLHLQLERLRAEYAQLAQINERLRGARSAEVAQREGVVQRQEAGLSALREQCVVLQHRTRDVLARMQQQQHGELMLSTPAAAAEAEAEAGTEVMGPSAQPAGCEVAKPAGGCVICASWQAVLEGVVGCSPSEGGHTGMRVREAETALPRGGCGCGTGNAGGAPLGRGKHGVRGAVAAAGAATHGSRGAPCVRTPQRPSPSKAEGEVLSSRTSHSRGSSPAAGGSYSSPQRTPARATVVTALHRTPPSTAAMRPLTPMMGLGLVAGAAALGSGS